jgi:hypothetical protein
VELRPITAPDTAALVAFVARIPEGDRAFLEAGALDPARVASWAGDQRARRVVAVDGADVVGIDRTGALQDLVILAHEVKEQWGAMATVGLDEALS